MLENQLHWHGCGQWTHHLLDAQQGKNNVSLELWEGKKGTKNYLNDESEREVKNMDLQEHIMHDANGWKMKIIFDNHNIWFLGSRSEFHLFVLKY